MTTKPIDLIVANVMHDATDALKKFDILLKAAERVGGRLMDGTDLNVEVARKLLCEIAHEASSTDVFRALAAVGAPSSIGDIKDGLQAVRDRQVVP